MLMRTRVSVLIFRLGVEWLAFRTQTIAEVTTPRPVHRVPHRSNEVLLGLVNLQGQVQLCVSLHGLLGVVAPVDSLHGWLCYVTTIGQRAGYSRLMRFWVFNTCRAASGERFPQRW